MSLDGFIIVEFSMAVDRFEQALYKGHKLTKNYGLVKAKDPIRIQLT
jgi:hypothetical protein